MRKALVFLLTFSSLAAVMWFALGRPMPPSESFTFERHQTKLDSQFFEDAGDKFRDQNLAEAASGAYKTALALGAPSGELYAKYGYALYELNEVKAAKSAFEKAKALGHKDEWLSFTEKSIEVAVDMRGPFPRFTETEKRTPSKNMSANETTRKSAKKESPRVALAKQPVKQPAKPLATDDEEEEEETLSEIDSDPPAASGGDCTLDLPRRWARGTFLIGATANDTDTTLILDTGATYTVLSRALIEEAGIEVNESPVITARTAAGLRRFQTAYVDSFWVGGREVRDLRVTICDECAAEKSAGLLGLDVQRALGMTLDVVNNRVHFSDCE